MLTAIQRKIYETLGIYSHRWTKRPNGLYSFNYHRIGDPDNSSFDPNVFSCDVESFEQQIKFFKTEFDVVTAKEVIDLVNNNKACSGKFALITFDDGYLDNYTLAYPILKQYNCSATMFIATDFINQTIVPWWDEVAWLIKNNDLNILDNIVWKKPNNISQLSKQNIIKLVLRAFKDDMASSIEDKLTRLKQSADKTLTNSKDANELFMTWEMLLTMAKNGIDIGSQTCSHKVLSHLPLEEQQKEIELSKATLEERLGQKIHAFAYPVGGADAFTNETQKLVNNAGYQFAMSFIANINKTPFDKFNLSRFSIDNQSNINTLKNNINQYI